MSEPRDSEPSRHRRPRAAAVSYERGTKAPRVVANGVGLIAERIVAAAREYGVPVREDPALVQALALLDLGEEIPEPLFVAVAETLAWAYRLDARSAGAA
jgi:flagellar biosynthesis protein